jgi:chromosome segregation ATPase
MFRVTQPPVAQIVELKPTYATLDDAEKARLRAEARARNVEASLDKTRQDLNKAVVNAQNAFKDGVVAGSKEAEQLRTDVEVLRVGMEESSIQVTGLRIELTSIQSSLTQTKGQLAVVQTQADTLKAQNDQFRERESALVQSMAGVEKSLDAAYAKVAESEKLVAKLKSYRAMVWTAVAVVIGGIVIWVLLRIKVL